MREIVFRVHIDQPGHLEARAEDRPLTIRAPSLEELHHEAREALIEHLGPAHGTFRVRIRRPEPRGGRQQGVLPLGMGRSERHRPPVCLG
ncbi:MAG: hypothetical protein VKM01_01620 [Cyanobacteriota bacterium]|nr:hypothetical protein [Cyanobacteriota bacterium]